MFPAAVYFIMVYFIMVIYYKGFVSQWMEHVPRSQPARPARAEGGGWGSKRHYNIIMVKEIDRYNRCNGQFSLVHRCWWPRS